MWQGTVLVSRQKFTREDAIELHTVAPLEASMRVTNRIPLGCPLPLTVTTVTSVQTLKVDLLKSHFATLMHSKKAMRTLWKMADINNSGTMSVGEWLLFSKHRFGVLIQRKALNKAFQGTVAAIERGKFNEEDESDDEEEGGSDTEGDEQADAGAGVGGCDSTTGAPSPIPEGETEVVSSRNAPPTPRLELDSKPMPPPQPRTVFFPL
jgi:hypothetical protein